MEASTIEVALTMTKNHSRHVYLLGFGISTHDRSFGKDAKLLSDEAPGLQRLCRRR